MGLAVNGNPILHYVSAPFSNQLNYSCCQVVLKNTQNNRTFVIVDFTTSNEK